MEGIFMSKNEKEIDLQVGKITFEHPVQYDFGRIRLETLIRRLGLRVSILERKVKNLERESRARK